MYEVKLKDQMNGGKLTLSFAHPPTAANAINNAMLFAGVKGWNEQDMNGDALARFYTSLGATRPLGLGVGNHHFVSVKFVLDERVPDICAAVASFRELQHARKSYFDNWGYEQASRTHLNDILSVRTVSIELMHRAGIEMPSRDVFDGINLLREKAVHALQSGITQKVANVASWLSLWNNVNPGAMTPAVTLAARLRLALWYKLVTPNSLNTFTPIEIDIAQSLMQLSNDETGMNWLYS